MRRWVATVSTLVALGGACSTHTTPAARGPVSRADGWFVPRPVPLGWRVVSATAAGYRSPEVTNTLYAPGGRVDHHGPTLLVGLSSDDDAMPVAESGDCSVPGLGRAVPAGIRDEQCAGLHSNAPASGYGLLHHFGAYTTLFWESDLEEDTSYYVVARGLSDARLARFARSVRRGHAPSVPHAGVPSGWKRVASAPPLPRLTLRAPLEIDLVAPGNQWTYVLAYRLDAGAATIDAFVAGLQRASAGAEFGYVSTQRRIGSMTVLVIARAPDPTLDAVARSIGPANERDWRRLQAAK
jgi:hypothetical protein